MYAIKAAMTQLTLTKVFSGDHKFNVFFLIYRIFQLTAKAICINLVVLYVWD